MLTVTNTLPTAEYSGKYYQRTYGPELICQFSHKGYNNGKIDSKKMKEQIDLFNKTLSGKIITVSFNKRNQKKLSGGACTALTLSVAKRGIDLFSQIGKRRPQYDEKRFIGFEIYSESMFIWDMKKIFNTLNIQSKRKGLSIRTRQAAFNCICVKKESDDPSLDKVRALILQKGFSVESFSDIIDLSENGSNKKVLGLLEKLNAGFYLVRVLQTCNDNEKLEVLGHTTLYIKLPSGKALYFDCNLGGYHAENKEGRESIVTSSLETGRLKYNTESCRFYKIVQG